MITDMGLCILPAHSSSTYTVLHESDTWHLDRLPSHFTPPIAAYYVSKAYKTVLVCSHQKRFLVRVFTYAAKPQS